ncbi:protein SGT1 homolog [Teleopsis dalmanni]|uniref:protein SGT1 homolog n=1 Tax=Teleopsis dalmanni TaxID=139649 RepID=UPI0018CCFF92|nr:protein SGT1 homolog [Teleopsis dalmanni]
MSVRHDWYQSETAVVVTIMLKNAVEKKYKVNITPERLEVSAEDYEFNVNLFRPINVERSSHKAYSTKIEINLAKEVGERWNSLEFQESNATAAVGLPTIHKKNWDGIAKEVEKSEEAEAQNEDALQRLFKKIYSSSSPEVQKAMNKSFSESGGTVLSTNWNEVSKDKVKIQPPEGTEFRKYE